MVSPAAGGPPLVTFKEYIMKKYPLSAIVDRTVTDHISITVEAESESAAYEIARKVLDRFPDPHGEEGCSFCYVDARENSMPELIDLRAKEEEAIA